MDKTYFLEIEDRFDDNKFCYKFTVPYNGLDIDGQAYAAIKQLLDLFKYYGVDVNRHISNTGYHIEDGEGNSRNIILDVNLNQGKLSKSHIRSKIGVLQKAQATPRQIDVYGKSAKYYFDVHNITEPINENASGIYLFTMLMEDSRQNVEFPHSILKLDSVAGSNKEIIEFAKVNGALHFLYNDCGSEHKRQEIINDIKEGENYKYQIETFPDTGYFPIALQ